MKCLEDDLEREHSSEDQYTLITGPLFSPRQSIVGPVGEEKIESDLFQSFNQCYTAIQQIIGSDSDMYMLAGGTCDAGMS